MTDDQMQAINEQFETVNRQFGTVNLRLDGVQAEIKDIKAEIKDIRADIQDIQAGAAEQGTTFARVDAEVHRQGVLREADSYELKGAIDAFQSVQHVMNAKLDVVRGSIDQRLVPLEVAVRSHTNTLADHARRLDRVEED